MKSTLKQGLSLAEKRQALGPCDPHTTNTCEVARKQLIVLQLICHFQVAHTTLPDLWKHSGRPLGATQPQRFQGRQQLGTPADLSSVQQHGWALCLKQLSTLGHPGNRWLHMSTHYPASPLPAYPQWLSLRRLTEKSCDVAFLLWL